METTNINFTAMPKILDEIFELKTKRNEAASTGVLEVYLASTENLWNVCRPYISNKQKQRAEKLDTELRKLFTYINGRFDMAKTYTSEMNLYQKNYAQNWKKVSDINREIEQLLFDCDIFGGLNGKQ